MPFNWQTFKTRALSAIVFVIVMLVGLLWNHWSFFVLFSIIHFGCWIEYQKLVEKIDPNYASISPVHRYGVMLAGWGFMIWMTNEVYSISGCRISDVGFWMLIIGFVAVNIETLISRRGKLIAHSLFGLLYISLSLGLMISLRGTMPKIFDLPKGVSLTEFISQSINRGTYINLVLVNLSGILMPIMLVACMWINDTMAYIVGSLIGKTPFSKISPKKTWEGTIGGAILCVLVVGFAMTKICESTGLIVDSYNWYIIAAIAAIFGTLGDLFESKLKRLAGVKDSGHMMPGHGGFLDRFDSLLIAVPFVWLYIWLFVGR
jgi:phosphatidate cytidylyltransferase